MKVSVICLVLEGYGWIGLFIFILLFIVFWVGFFILFYLEIKVWFVLFYIEYCLVLD